MSLAFRARRSSELPPGGPADSFACVGDLRAIVICAALALTISPAVASAQAEPLVLAPDTDWVLDYAEHSCALRRAFRAGEEKAILEIRRYTPGDSIEILLVSDTLERTGRLPVVHPGRRNRRQTKVRSGDLPTAASLPTRNRQDTKPLSRVHGSSHRANCKATRARKPSVPLRL